MAIAFDGPNKRIILDRATVSSAEIWSAWVDWHPLNTEWSIAMRQSGGGLLVGSIYEPVNFFLMNGWRVRPMEANHKLVITGNLFVDGGGDPVVQTLGNYNVSVQYTVPLQAQAIQSGGSNLSQTDVNNIVSTIWNSMKADSGIPGSYGEHIKSLGGAGTNSVSVLATSITRNIGTDQGGILSNIFAHDDSYFSTGEVSGQGLVVTVQTTTDPSYIPNSIRLVGYYAGSASHSMVINVFNYVLDVYEAKGTMLNRSTPFEYTIPLTIDNMDENGNVSIELRHNVGTYLSSHRLHIDFVEFIFTNTYDSLSADIVSIKNITDQITFTLGRLNANSQMISDNIAAADTLELNIANLNKSLLEMDAALTTIKNLTVAGL